MGVVVAIDAGTTHVRTLAVGEDGVPRAWSHRELTQYFPRPGWVEHDPDEIWAAVQVTLAEVRSALGSEAIAAIGITNQRETVVAWNRSTGRAVHRAIVWQDRRTAGRCDALNNAGYAPEVRRRTGLVIDPYFSATKLGWLLEEGGIERSADLAFGTVDSWVLWNLTGVHATDPSNAARTLLYDIHRLSWSPELCELFGVPPECLPDVLPSSGHVGTTPEGIPVSGIAGDQQAALFGQACFAPGMAKATYGTGSFVLMNVGEECPEPTEGLLATIAWQLRTGITYALEGSVFVGGAAVQWLRDGLEVIREASETADLAAGLADNEGVYFVPALAGLGSPWWDPYARGTIVGLTRGTGRAHLARATLEAIAYQVRDVVEAMSGASGRTLSVLRVDGGASANDLLLQIQADQLQCEVHRPAVADTTALGAAFLAGLAVGVWGSITDIADRWHIDSRIAPEVSASRADAQYTEWRRAVQRARGWAT